MTELGRPKLFIYDRKEVLLLLLIAVMVAIFSFTLGVHLGKKVTLSQKVHLPGDASLVGTEADAIPNRQELAEQAKGVQQAGDESLGQALHDEVTKTGIKLNVPKQVELPKVTKSEKAEKKASQKTSQKAANYSVQVGSFPSEKDARQRLRRLEQMGMDGFIHSAQIKGKGKWFRLYTGHFATKELATAQGLKLKKKKIIDSFVVSNVVE